MKGRLRAAALAAALAVLASPSTASGLEPYQMMRSLQVVQDRIAGGDQAALPMQRKLLGIIDKRLQNASPAEFGDRRNFDALLVYGTSGGNPETLEQVISTLHLEGEDRRLADGIISYARGDFDGAREALADFAPLEADSALAAPLALVLGSVFSQPDPAGALKFLDIARLLSPGTLIEEAALRRSIAISAGMLNTERFALASLQYVRRFLRSPYASQFAEAFVAGIIAHHEDIDLEMVKQVVTDMTPEQAHVIYLRIARQSAIEGYDRLLEFASRNADAYAGPEENDPRAILYANIASVTSDNVEQVLATLESLDARRLSPRDRQLLDAATAVARTVVSPPEPAGRKTAAPELPTVPASHSSTPVDPEKVASDPFVASTMEKLQSIDELLEEKNP